MTDGGWLSLFSGGKDSAYALHLARESGLSVEGLLTVHPEGDSYMYHVPATHLAGLAAESIGLPLYEVEAEDFGPGAPRDAGKRGDREIEPLAEALANLDRPHDGGLAGITVGAIESEFQATRVQRVADRLGLEVFAPLWHREPLSLGREMVAAGFEVRIVRVAAAGLDESWLGRVLDGEALAELAELREEYGVHVLGEGGEFETLVTDGPHMDRAIRLATEAEWDGTRGRLHVEDAWLV
ncbi:MAG: diphthine--ammonia ligase [Haloarculaceae archaeon]